MSVTPPIHNAEKDVDMSLLLSRAIIWMSNILLN